MAGYKDDYSMSNNAADAYEAGEKPLSKWTKKNILAIVGQEVINRNPELKALNLKELRAIFLTQDGWHHTSKFYNETNFYACRTLQDIKDNPEDTISELYIQPPYKHPMVPVAASLDSREYKDFFNDLEDWEKQMKRLEYIIQDIADGTIK